MKPTATALLVLSLIVNIAFGIQWFRGSSSTSETNPQTALNDTKALDSASEDSQDAKPDNSTNARNSVTFDWHQVESEDYRAYIDNLRSIGCPEETIRDIIKADVDKLYSSKLDELKPEREPFEYWKTGNSWIKAMQPDAGSLQEQNALNSEKRGVLKALLGEDYEPETNWLESMTGGFNPFEQMLDFLSPTKQASVMETYQKYAAKQAELAMNGAMDQEDMKALMEIQRERDRELAKLMTPQEKKDFDLRMSDSAMMLRSQLTGFNPTKDEFEQIFDLKKSFDDEHGTLGMAYTDQESRKVYQEAESEYEESIAALLGEDRYDEYQMGKDYNYQGLKKAAERYGAETETAKELYTSMQTAQSAARSIRNNADLDQTRKREMLQGIRGETEALLVDSFGQEGFEKYSKENYANWLNQIDRGFTDEAIMDEAMMQRYGLQPQVNEVTTEAISD